MSVCVLLRAIFIGEVGRETAEESALNLRPLGKEDKWDEVEVEGEWQKKEQ
jgi:hypothetical protein